MSAPKETALVTIDPAAGGMSGAEDGPMSTGQTACREPRATDGDGVRPRLKAHEALMPPHRTTPPAQPTGTESEPIQDVGGCSV
jgi:hypothetical protein